MKMQLREPVIGSLFLWFYLLFGLSLNGYTASQDPQSTQIERVITQLEKKGMLSTIAQSPIWHQLLHYERGVFGDASRSDGEHFFLSSEKTPLSELKANIQALYKQSLKINHHFTCTFPARAHFILSHLQSKIPLALSKVNCPKRDAFLKDLNIHGVELVYASASFGQSSSMFGHTMLRIIRGAQQSRLTDPMMSFVALTTVGGLGEVFYGLTGGFVGVIEVSNFAQQIINYTVREQRNLWTMKLKIPPSGLKRLAEHLWEMNSTFFYYHFFDENCAFYNQKLLQIALPNHSLLEEMSWVSLPIESVYALSEKEDLIQQITFYPSAHQVASNGWSALNSQERSLLYSVLKKPRSISLPKERAALLYKTALNMSLIQTYRNTLKVNEQERAPSDQLTKLLVSTQLDPQLVYPDHTNPLIGTGPHTLSLGGGVAERNRPFIDLELRPILHGREDNPLSYERYNEITLLKTRVRYHLQDQNLDLDQLTLGALYNFRTWSFNGPLISTPLSWAFDVGFRDASRFKRGLDFYTEFAWGDTFPLGSIGAIAVMAGPLSEVGFNGSARFGLHAFTQLTLYPHERWSVNVRGGTRHFKWDSFQLDQQEDWLEGTINCFIGRSFTLNLRGRTTRLQAHRELVLDLKFHWF
jgi:hypothetical protein